VAGLRLMKRVFVKRQGKSAFAPIKSALDEANIQFKSLDDPSRHVFTFLIGIDYFPQAEIVFEQLKNDGRIDGYELDGYKVEKKS
jgi:hypothetical protein